MLLLPGTLCDRRVFEAVLARMPDREVIVADMTGAETARALAARILENAPDSFALAGFSLGGIVALEMVAQAPGRVTRLALLDTTARPDPEANHAVRRNAVTRAAQMGVDRYVSDKLWSLYVSGDHRADGAIRATIVDMSARTGLAAFASQSEIAIHRADSRPRLGVIAMPTLVLCGEDDRLCPVEVHREMADAIVGADLVVVPRSGHFALLEQPEAVAAALTAWLGRPAAPVPNRS